MPASDDSYTSSFGPIQITESDFGYSNVAGVKITSDNSEQEITFIGSGIPALNNDIGTGQDTATGTEYYSVEEYQNLQISYNAGNPKTIPLSDINSVEVSESTNHVLISTYASMQPTLGLEWEGGLNETVTYYNTQLMCYDYNPVSGVLTKIGPATASFLTNNDSFAAYTGLASTINYQFNGVNLTNSSSLISEVYRQDTNRVVYQNTDTPTSLQYNFSMTDNTLTVDPGSRSASVVLSEDTKGNITGSTAAGSFSYSDTDTSTAVSQTVGTDVVTATDKFGRTVNLSANQISALESPLTINTTGSGGAKGSISYSYNLSGPAVISSKDLDFMTAGETATVQAPITFLDGDGNNEQTNLTITISGPQASDAGVDFKLYNPAQTNALVQGTNAHTVGYYLAPAPSQMSNTSWMGHRLNLLAQGWQIAPLYLGRQSDSIDQQGLSYIENQTGTPSQVAALDATSAVSLMANQGFARGTTVFLDVEGLGSQNGADPLELSYISNWCADVKQDGYGAGVYCGNGTAQYMPDNAKLWISYYQDTQLSTSLVDTTNASQGGAVLPELNPNGFSHVPVSVGGNVVAVQYAGDYTGLPGSLPHKLDLDTWTPGFLKSGQLLASNTTEGASSYVASIAANQSYSLDPFGHDTYIIDTAAGSPEISTLTLPSSSASAYSVSFAPSGGAYATAQTVQALQEVVVPSGTSSIQVHMLNADGSVDTNPSDLSFLVNFASSGAADVTVTAPPPTSVVHSSALYVSQFQASQTGEVATGTTVSLKLTMSEAVTVDASGGMPALSLDNGATATYDAQASNPGQGALAFDYTVGAGDSSPNLYATNVNLNGATVADAQGNGADFSGALYTPTNLQVGPATIVSVQPISQPTNVTTDQNVQLSVSLNQGVSLNTAAGTPTLSLSNGAVATYDASASNPTSGNLVFDDIVDATDYAVGLTTTSLNLNGAALTDANRVAADLSGAEGFGLGFDVNAAIVNAITPSQTGEADAGTPVTLTLTMNEAVIVDPNGGALTLSLDDGATATYDTQASNPANGTLVFDYTVGADDQSPNLQAIAVNLNGATVYDGNGNPADLANALYNPTGLQVGAPICFAAGTQIRIMRGGAILDLAVESLSLGDLAVTASGALRPIRWLGQRKINCCSHTRPRDTYPVRIAAHAFDEDRPARDLYLSQGHPVLVGAEEDGRGGHFVPIMCLLNGTTIERVVVDEIAYWHVELDNHDIILAENLPAESYIDLGSRKWFAGADGLLYGPDLALSGMQGRCRPVAIDGPVVEAERRRLDALFATRLAAQCAWPTADAMALGI